MKLVYAKICSGDSVDIEEYLQQSQLNFTRFQAETWTDHPPLLFKCSRIGLTKAEWPR